MTRPEPLGRSANATTQLGYRSDRSRTPDMFAVLGRDRQSYWS
jgi:hypothetical protein